MARVVRGVVCSVGLACGVQLSGCGTYGYNFLHPREPRFAGEAAKPAERSPGGPIRLVSFNIKFGREPNVERAVKYLVEDPVFRRPDVLLLQEVNCEAVAAIAAALEASWVYYPAAWHPKGSQWKGRREGSGSCPAPAPDSRAGGLFGVAVVSPWRILDDQKILLPQLSRSDAAQKVALAATIDYGGAYRLRVVDVHLQSGLTPMQVGDQAQVVVQCVFGEVCPAGSRVVPVASWAKPHGTDGAPGNVVLAGDFNTPGEAHIQVLKTVLAPRAEPTALPAATFWLLAALDPDLGRLDHVFHGPGLKVTRSRVGTTKVSDHRPVLVELAAIEP